VFIQFRNVQGGNGNAPGPEISNNAVRSGLDILSCFHILQAEYEPLIGQFSGDFRKGLFVDIGIDKVVLRGGRLRGVETDPGDRDFRDPAP
jgi:hypothetical protein